MVIWCILQSFLPFWYVVLRTFWQPWFSVEKED
jgi:hypothetical protein